MEENKLLTFLSKHWSTLLTALLCVAALGFFAQRRAAKQGMGAKRDYIVCRKLFERFQAGEFLSTEATIEAEGILKRHPELTPKYSVQLATALLLQENPDRAAHYFSHANKNLYHTFSEGTLSIAHQDYPAALAGAQSLEQTLAANETYLTLRSFNLLRIVFLAKQQGDTALMQKSFETLQTLPTYEEISLLFNEGELSLENYVTS